MEGPTAFYNLRGPSPVVLAMRTRFAAPPPPSSYPPAPPPIPIPPPPPLAPPQQKRRRGRPRKCDLLLPPPGFVPSPDARTPPPPRPLLAPHVQLGGLQPHVLRIAAGEDIVSRIVALSRLYEKAICVLSVLGVIQEATLLQSSGGISTHKGTLEIIRLSGSILTPGDNGCLSVTLASPYGSVIGGVIGGPLIAVTPVQAIVGSFRSDAYQPNKKPKIGLHCSNSQVITANGSTPSSEHSDLNFASCTTVEQSESNQIDTKPSVVVA